MSDHDTDPIKAIEGGTVQLIEKWGSDEGVIRAARMSTNKGFQGWEKDAKLLKYLYANKHYTPFEMAGLQIEVKAPIFVFREWHRHRTQSYNEMSARYTPMPNDNYTPSLERLLQPAGSNKQAQGVNNIDPVQLDEWQKALEHSYEVAENAYKLGLAVGVPKELARLSVPVARFSRMRAQSNLRNWLHFLSLRMHPHAQWEIRQYALCISGIIAEQFPRTHELFIKEFLQNGN